MRALTDRGILAGCVAALLVAVTPALGADRGACERALAKASAKFVDATFKSAQRCLLRQEAGRLPASACRLMADSTEDPRIDSLLARAKQHLAQGTAPCSDTTLGGMGFDGACDQTSPDGFTRGDLNSCIAHTHMQAVQAMVSVQFPLVTDNCGNGVIDTGETCDPSANPSGCAAGETCGAAGTADACSCIAAGGTCGNGTKDAGEQCDPTATPTGCAAGMTCVAAGQPNECTCADQSGNQCQGTCTPTCGAGKTCRCTCGTGGLCGNGTRDPGEQCDPMANPSGCAAGMICGAPGSATQCTCTTSSDTCGNGVLDPTEKCDPALPNACDPGEVCLTTGATKCTCGAPPANCGNGLIEWGETCDPAANPTGCAAGQTCKPKGSPGQCTCSTGGGLCGNGTIDAGEACDPAAHPTGCAAGTTCDTSCTCVTGTTTTIPGGGGGCCAAMEIVTTSSEGTLQVSTLPAFPFPAGVTTKIDLGPPDAGCKHDAIIPAGGFTVPAFCIPSLQFTSAVIPKGCESGGADGKGTVWDGAATAPDPNVTRVGDTSDGTCNPAGQPCNTGAGGAGNNTQGDINTTRGGSPLPAGGVHTQVDVPVTSVTWLSAGGCPDPDGAFTPGTDTIVTQFDFILSPTTGHSSATFTDLNGDGCKRAGGGPDMYQADGSPAQGPCCTVGQATTVVATGIAFTGGAPLFDIAFTNSTPTTISACNPAPASLGSCVLTTDHCQD